MRPYFTYSSKGRWLEQVVLFCTSSVVGKLPFTPCVADDILAMEILEAPKTKEVTIFAGIEANSLLSLQILNSLHNRIRIFNKSNYNFFQTLQKTSF